MRVGFIGLGHMGAAMAANLLRAGHELTVYNRTPEKAQGLVEQGASRAERVADACAGDAVITMLADDAAVEQVVLGEAGVLASLGKQTVHISMSTISMALCGRLAEAHAGAGRRFVAAPVFGRPEAAAAARLFIVAGGKHEAVAACAELFEALGQKTLPLGEQPQQACLAKLGANFLIAAMIEALGEAIALTSKGGLDARQYVELLTATLFPAPLYENYGKLIADRAFKPAGFAAPLGLKDLRLALAAAADLQVSMPLADLLQERFVRLLAEGGEKLDWSAVGGLALRDAGLEQAPHEL